MNKLRGTRSIGCKGKAGKEGGSKQGQTKKPKAEAEEDGGGQRTEKMRGTPGTRGTRGTGGGSRKASRKCIQEMHNTKKTAESLPQSFVFCFPSVRGSLRDTTLFGGLLRRGFGRSLCRNLSLGHRGGRLGLKDTLLKCLGVLRNFAVALCDAPLVHGERSHEA